MFMVSNNYSNSLIYLINKIMSTTLEILLSLLDQICEVSSMVQIAFLFLVLKYGILYLLKEKLRNGNQ